MLSAEDLGARGITTFDRVISSVGALFVGLSLAPIIVWLAILFSERYLEQASEGAQTGLVVSASILTVFFFSYQCYRAFCKFSPHRHTLHPAFFSPRLVLFLELHPVWGLFIPATAMLRGFHVFALLRWAMNFTAAVLLLINDQILQKAYDEACCYGKEHLDGSEPGSCTNLAFSELRGMEECEASSPSQKSNEKAALTLIAISAAMQLCNVMTITWSTRAQITRLVRKTIDGKFRIQGHEDLTVDVHKILRLMGMPLSIEKEVFSGLQEPDADLSKRTHRLHHHPHWCMPGVYRLLVLDPIFGLTLSLHDFLTYSNTTGTLRILMNFIGATLIIVSIEILQPLHAAWCCYGADSYKDNHFDGEHHTCDEWVQLRYGPTKDTRIPNPFEDSKALPNGSCLQYHTIGLAASVSLACGFVLVFISTMIWVYSVENSADAEKMAAKRLYRRVLPDQRYLFLQTMDLMGIEHGFVTIKKDD